MNGPDMIVADDMLFSDIIQLIHKSAFIRNVQITWNK